MHWEQLAANELGLAWSARILGPVPEEHKEIAIEFPWSGSTSSPLAAWILLRWRYNFWLWRQRKDFDLFLLRYNVHDPLQVIFLLLMGRRALLVHHAIEVDELRSFSGPMSRLRTLLEVLTGKLSVTLASGVLGVTDEIVRHQVARSLRPKRFSATYPNGIHLPVEPASDNRSEVPTFLFVASEFEPWQGLDLLLSSAATSTADFKVHVVGSLNSALRESAAVDERFVLHGHLEPTMIRRFASESWLGLSSLALWRQGLTQACALKVRDYLAWGLPCAGSYEETLPNGFKFYSQTEVAMPALLEIAHMHRHTPRDEVATASAPFISKTGAFNQMYESLQHNFCASNDSCSQDASQRR